MLCAGFHVRKDGRELVRDTTQTGEERDDRIDLVRMKQVELRLKPELWKGFKACLDDSEHPLVQLILLSGLSLLIVALFWESRLTTQSQRSAPNKENGFAPTSKSLPSNT